MVSRNTSPALPDLYLAQYARLRGTGRPFAQATVVQVEGSTSARTGSKALFDEKGENVFGWVGGGCAETFVASQALEAMEEGLPRTVFVNLDDQVFGLGIACGGVMRVFIEPVLPPLELLLPRPVSEDWQEKLAFLVKDWGFVPRWSQERAAADSLGDLFLIAARALAGKRGRGAGSLRDQGEGPGAFVSPSLSFSPQALIIGKSRITEALARYFTDLGWDTAVTAFSLDGGDFPPSARCQVFSGGKLIFPRGGITVVASHHARDPDFVKQALEADCAYVGMIGSLQRSREVFDFLDLQDKENPPSAFFIPAGLDIDAQTPQEIALSVTAEILALSQGGSPGKISSP